MLRASCRTIMKGSAFLQRNSNSSKPNICVALSSFQSQPNSPCKSEPCLTVSPLTAVLCMKIIQFRTTFACQSQTHIMPQFMQTNCLRNLVERTLCLSSSSCTAPRATVCISPNKVLLRAIFKKKQNKSILYLITNINQVT